MITALCLFGCPHVVEHTDPWTVHRLMEAHYTQSHSEQIDRMLFGRHA